MRQYKVKRIYEDPLETDGFRILVDHLWPRGVKKSEAKIDYWAKELTPELELITWFHEDRAKRYKTFANKYRAYLDAKSLNVDKIITNNKTISLITAVKDIEHSHIPDLVKFLNKHS